MSRTIGTVGVVPAAYSGACWLALFADTAFFNEGTGPLEQHAALFQGPLVIGVDLTPVVLLYGLWQLSARVRKQSALIRSGLTAAEAKRVTRPQRSVLKFIVVPLGTIVIIWLIGLTVLLVSSGGRIPF